jgi:hypothetical protein
LAKKGNSLSRADGRANPLARFKQRFSLYPFSLLLFQEIKTININNVVVVPGHEIATKDKLL